MINEFERFASLDRGISPMTLGRYNAAVDRYINPTIVVDGYAQEDDTVHEQAAEDVHGGHVHLPLFDDGR